MGRKFTCFTSVTGVVGMLMTAGLKASEGAEADYEWEWSPYVTVRGGWLFGKAKFNERLEGVGEWNLKKNPKSGWSGSGEFGVALCDEKVFLGLELGYFAGKTKFERGYNPMPRMVIPAGASPLMPGGGTIDLMKLFVDGKMRNFFGALNVTLRRDLNERAFLYGGVGAGIARSRCSYDINGTVTVNIPPNPVVVANFRVDGGKNKWRFLGQAFAGLGMHLNENWSLGVGYRLRYLPGRFEWKEKIDAIAFEEGISVKQDIVHAAEVGLTYSF